MIDFNKPLECDLGKVDVAFAMSSEHGAAITLSDESGEKINYWVSADGIPQPDFLDDSFNVRNVEEE